MLTNLRFAADAATARFWWMPCQGDLLSRRARHDRSLSTFASYGDVVGIVQAFFHVRESRRSGTTNRWYTCCIGAMCFAFSSRWWRFR